MALSCLVACAGGAEEAQPSGAKEKLPRRKPLCLVQITQRSGPPSDRCALLAYQDGAYLVLARDGHEYSVRESEIRLVRFYPLRDAREGSNDRGAGVRDEAERPATTRQPTRGPALRGPRSEQPGRWLEQRLKPIELRLEKMKREGTLEAYVGEQEQQLRKARDILAARQLLTVLALARRVKLGRGDPAYNRSLIETIEDPGVRDSPELRLGPPYGRGRLRP